MKLSPARLSWPILKGLELISRGKVRDMYRLKNVANLPNGFLLIVATDAISIFDFVLNAIVPGKGISLNIQSHFWLMYLESLGFKTHLVAAGSAIDQYLPEHLRNDIDLQSRAMVVKAVDMAEYEFVYRLCLMGSVKDEYAKTGKIYGHCLPPGLEEGDAFPYILDTPTTKAENGHDMPVNPAVVREKYPEAVYRMIQMVQAVDAFAQTRGIKLFDTKLEGSNIILADEAFTTDSSRWVDLRAWKESRKPETGRKAPPPLDKEQVRIEGRKLGINKLNPENPDDVKAVHAIEWSEEIIRKTTHTYRYLPWRLTGMTIEKYLKSVLGVSVEKIPPKKIAVICGSESDKPTVMNILSSIDHRHAHIDLHILSCHRNPNQTALFVKTGCEDVDIVICVGGKAFALPGVIDAIAHEAKEDIRVIGVALGEPGSKSLEAAKLSIEEIPGQTVLMDEISGAVYQGREGFISALDRAIFGELPPERPRTEKPAQINAWSNWRQQLA
jgi:phosphoribosylaminoimidazole-succinocarboxamide synthase